jgi:phosphate transport system substrate-binding protein
MKQAMLCLAVALAVVFVPTFALAQVAVDEDLPSYEPQPGVSGTIKSVGSDTMNNLMTLWAEGFLKFYPSVRVEIEGKGSSTAPPALIAGTATFGPMSRLMKAEEIDQFEKKYGYKPVQIGTSIDMLAVFVNKDNPIKDKGLTFPQLDAIFSSTRKLGMDEITTWGQVGLEGEFANAPISLYGRNEASGTYAYFKKNVLAKGDYKESVKAQPGSSAVVNAVAGDKFAMGYSGIGYKTADVEVAPLAKEEGGEMVPAVPANAYNGKYPLARFLYLSVNYRPGSQLDPLRREFIKYVFSYEGQQCVVKDGYFPVSAKVAENSLAEVGLSFDDY